MINAKFKKAIYSIVIISVWVIILFIAFYPDNGGLGRAFVVLCCLLFTLYLSLAIGYIALILRLLNWLRVSSFFYIFAGVLNLCMGIYGFMLILLHYMDVQYYILLHVAGLSTGLIIMWDVFFNKKIFFNKLIQK
jgi:protein-tyrosine phosphatase